MLVFEFGRRIEPPGDPHVRRVSAARERSGLGDADLGCRGEEPPDPVPGSERSEHEHADRKRGETDADQGRGSHGGDDTAPGRKGPEGTYSTRGR